MKDKVDLTLVKKLVSELEASLELANKLGGDGASKNEFAVELSKATGLASGIATEAVLLVGDIQSLMRVAPTSSPNDLLSKIFGPKGSGAN